MKDECEELQDSMLSEMFPLLRKKGKEIATFELNWNMEKKYLEVVLID